MILNCEFWSKMANWDYFIFWDCFIEGLMKGRVSGVWDRNHDGFHNQIFNQQTPHTIGETSAPPQSCQANLFEWHFWPRSPLGPNHIQNSCVFPFRWACKYFIPAEHEREVRMDGPHRHYYTCHRRCKGSNSARCGSILADAAGAERKISTSLALVVVALFRRRHNGSTAAGPNSFGTVTFVNDNGNFSQ